jgi:hypothetical protein
MKSAGRPLRCSEPLPGQYATPASPKTSRSGLSRPWRRWRPEVQGVGFRPPVQRTSGNGSFRVAQSPHRISVADPQLTSATKIGCREAADRAARPDPLPAGVLQDHCRADDQLRRQPALSSWATRPCFHRRDRRLVAGRLRHLTGLRRERDLGVQNPRVACGGGIRGAAAEHDAQYRDHCQGERADETVKGRIVL